MKKNHNNEIPFQKPDIFATYTEAPPSIKKLVFSKIIPSVFINPILSIGFILFLSPMIVLFSDSSIPKDKDIQLFVIMPGCILFLMFTAVIGIVLISFKSPKFQEIKEWLGYNE